MGGMQPTCNSSSIHVCFAHSEPSLPGETRVSLTWTRRPGLVRQHQSRLLNNYVHVMFDVLLHKYTPHLASP